MMPDYTHNELIYFWGNIRSDVNRFVFLPLVTAGTAFVLRRCKAVLC